MKVVSPTTEDLDFLTNDLGIPESFIADIADADERPRTEEEEGWNLTIVRIPIVAADSATPYTTIPIGIIYSPERHIMITVCYHRTQLMPDFIGHNRDGFHFPLGTQLGRMVPKVPQADKFAYHGSGRGSREQRAQRRPFAAHEAPKVPRIL